MPFDMMVETETETKTKTELQVAHEAQIEALTARGLTDEERVRRSCEAARFHPLDMRDAMESLRGGASPAKAVWYNGGAAFSLFGNLPGCECPVIEVANGNAAFPGIPDNIPFHWRPTAAELEPFSRVQREQRGDL
jgi:hypothetical protein